MKKSELNQQVRYGNVNAARMVAMKDMRSETVDRSSPKHSKYKREGYVPSKNGEFDLSDAPYFYNYALGFVVSDKQ